MRKKNSVLRFTQKVKILELNTAAWTPPKVDHSEQFKPKFESLQPSEAEIQLYQVICMFAPRRENGRGRHGRIVGGTNMYLLDSGLE